MSGFGQISVSCFPPNISLHRRHSRLQLWACAVASGAVASSFALCTCRKHPRLTDTRVASVPSPFLRRLHLFHSCPPVYAHIHVAASCRLASSPHLPVASFKDVTGGDTTRCDHNGTVTITAVGTAAAVRRSGPEYVFATLRSRALAQFWCRIRTVLRELLQAGVSRGQPICAVNSVCLLRLSPSPPVEATAEGGGIAGSAHPGLICAYNRAARRRG